MTNLLIGLFSVRKNRALSGLSAKILAGFPMGRRAGFGLLLAADADSGCPGVGVADGAGVTGGRGVVGVVSITFCTVR